MYQVLIDGKVRVKPLEITGAKSYENAEVYAGDKYYSASEADIKNLVLGDCVNEMCAGSENKA